MLDGLFLSSKGSSGEDEASLIRMRELIMRMCASQGLRLLAPHKETVVEILIFHLEKFKGCIKIYKI